MSPRLTLILLGIVILPLAIVGWLAGRTARNERAVAEQQFRELARLRLEAVATDLNAHFGVVLDELVRELDSAPQTIGECRDWTESSLTARQLYVLNAQRSLVYPPIATPPALTSQERESLRRTEMIWDEGALATQVFVRDESGAAAGSDSGWFTWYWGGGLRWIAWHRANDLVYAVEIHRVRAISEIINVLPDTRIGSDELADAQLRLLDSSGGSIYHWGQYEAEMDSVPVVRVPATGPLSAWTLEYHTVLGTAGSLSRVGWIAGVLALAVAVGALAYYLHREQTRSLREAGRRVSFVNQVSHELKTPLTNIRMYAELMSDDLGEPDEKAGRRLEVIVAESRRLSRLIANVLTFSGEQNRSLELHLKPTVLDDVVRTVVDSFRPALTSCSIETELTLDAANPIDADPDRLEQVVGNLVGNVEKYAADGRYLGISTSVADGYVELTVEDRGRGIPESAVPHIFDPFYRVDDSLTEGVSGTGIGLAIARDLTILHGGDLIYEALDRGSRFRLRIPVTLERA